MTKNSVLLLVCASFSASILVGCGEGPQRNSTANQAVLHKKCESPRGFNTEVSNDELARTLKAKFSNPEMKPVVNYPASFKAPAQTSMLDTSKPMVVMVSADEFSAGSGQIDIQKNCENLTAALSFNGMTLTELKIKDIKVREMSFTKVTDQGEVTITVKREGVRKITVRPDLKFKSRDEAQQEALVLADIQAGDTTTTITFEIAGANAQKVEMVQRTGAFDDSTVVKVAPSSLRMLRTRTEGQIVPQDASISGAAAGPSSLMAAIASIPAQPEPGEKDDKKDVVLASLLEFQEVIPASGTVTAEIAAPAAAAPEPDAAPVSLAVEPQDAAASPAAAAAASPGSSVAAPGTSN